MDIAVDVTSWHWRLEAAARYRSQLRMLFPGRSDWRSAFAAHATLRRPDAPAAERLFVRHRLVV